MKMTTFEERCEIDKFAKCAAQHFAKNANHTTYTEDEIKPGCLFALRFGMDMDCVVVFRLDENMEPINFQQAIYQGGEK